MNFYQAAGHMALGSRMRQLGDVMLRDAEKIFRLYEVDIDPRWFPVFYMLTVKQSAAITELAEDIGQSHAAVSQVVKGMIERKIATTRKSRDDGRVSRVTLTAKGRKAAEKLAVQCADVGSAVDDLFRDTGSQLWAELDVIQQEISRKSLCERVIEARRRRELGNIEIVAYQPRYRKAFRELNVAWIEKHWDLEPADLKTLDRPTENIINRGGYIAVVLNDGKPAGVCALLKMPDGGMEMAKMAVAETARNTGIGRLLGEHMIAKARDLGAWRMYLESNTTLESAIRLYRKLGFREVAGGKSPYQRCNIQMELKLTDS